MRIRVVTLFPEMVDNLARFGITGRACEQGLVSLACTNPRDFASDVHRTVDDRPYGGGPGMVMKYEPLCAAIDAAQTATGGGPVICLSPQGKRFDQAAARRLAKLDRLVLVAGRYEGIDERVIEAKIDEELSLGDYVISGGELAAMVVIDALVRLKPGAVGDEASVEQDSFSDDLLDCPHYTRPEEVDGRKVPPVLLSGDHQRIAEWRRSEALRRTSTRRPDLLERRGMTGEERRLLESWSAGGAATRK